MDRDQAIHQFWSGFGLKAYDENTVPDKALTLNNGKYLTYAVVISTFNQPNVSTVSLWYKDTSWAAISQKAQQIGDALGEGGSLVAYDNGALWVKRGSPFAQRMSDEDDTIRRIYINVEYEFLS